MQDGRGGIDFKCLCTSENIRRKRLYSKEDGCFQSNSNLVKIIDRGLYVDEETQSATRFEDSLKFYFKFYICRIIDVVSKGYDWDVVCEMLREDKAFTDLIKPLVDNGIMQESKTANDQEVEL